MLSPTEIPLWQLVIAQFRLTEPTDHGPSHWLTILRNGMELCRHHPADAEIVRLFALLKIPNIQYPISLPHSPCRIHNGGMPQSEPTLAVCLDADRLDLGRVGINPDPLRLSTSTAKSIASDLSPTPLLIHGGSAKQEREKAIVLPWNGLGELVDG